MRRTALLAALAAFVLLALTPAVSHALGGIKGDHFDPRASRALQSYKLKFGYTNSAAFVAARSGECASRGIICDDLVEGMMFWDNSADDLKYYDGAAWQTYVAAGGGVTLDAAYSSGQAIVRDLDPFSITDGTAGASHTLTVTRTLGSGACVSIDNTGTGDDIEGLQWSIDEDGYADFDKLLLGDNEGIVFGATDVTLDWDGAGSYLHFDTGATGNVPVRLGADGTGMDLLLYSDAAGEVLTWDASVEQLIFTDSDATFTDAYGLILGTGADFAVNYDGTDFNIDGPDDEPVRIGLDGHGQKVYLFSDTAGAYFVFDSDTLMLIGDGVDVWLKDGDEERFGDAAGGDVALSWTGAAFKFDAAGNTPVHFGVDGTGLDVHFFGDTAGDTIIFDQSTGQLEFVDIDLVMDDGADLFMGVTNLDIPADGFSVAGSATELFIDAIAAGGAGDEKVMFGGTNDTDVLLTGSTGSCFWDYGADTLTLNSADLLLGDDDILEFGDVPDVTATWTNASSLLQIAAAVDGTPIHLGTDQHGMDLVLYADGGAAGDGCEWDADSARGGGRGVLTCEGADINMEDGDYLLFGWSGGPANYHGSLMYDNALSATVFNDSASNKSFYFGEDDEGLDVKFFGATAGDYVEWDESLDALTAVGADIILDADSDIYIGVANPAAPADGFKFDGTGGANLDIDAVNAGDDIVWGSNVDTDQQWVTAAGNIYLDHGLDRVWTDAVDIFMTDDDLLGFGVGGGSGPDATLDWHAATPALLLDSSGDADFTFQLGTSAANHKVSLQIGATATSAVTFDGNATAGTVATLAGNAMTVEHIELPAGMFSGVSPSGDVDGGAHATYVWEGRLGTAHVGGWVLPRDATDDIVSILWQPPKWVDTTTDVELRILYYGDDGGAAKVVPWEIRYLQMTPDVTLATAGLTTVEADDTTVGTAWVLNKSANITLPQAVLDITARKPVLIQVVYDDDDANETFANDIVFTGLEMDVTRKYMD